MDKLRQPIVLTLFDASGVVAGAFLEAGVSVVRVDKAPYTPERTGERLLVGDIPRLVQSGAIQEAIAGRPVLGVVGMPPCTAFSKVGARWWADPEKYPVDGPGPLHMGLALVFSTLSVIQRADPAWWVIENPAGRLKYWLDPFCQRVGILHPWEYASLSDDPDTEHFRKLTILWGVGASMPEKAPHRLGKPESGWRGSWVERLPGVRGGDGQRLRSRSFQGMWRAFARANIEQEKRA